MSTELHRIRRYELKYLVTEEQASAIREHVQGFCSLDSHSSPELGGYVVNNLYLDTPDLRFYWDVKFRRLTRVKTRLRYYGRRLKDSVWLELKYRQGSIIWKVRRRIAAEQWPGVLEPSVASTELPRFQDGSMSFEDVASLLGVEPVLHARYFREPWVSDIDDYGRVTIDRRLTGRMANGSYGLECEDRDLSYYDDPVTMGEVDSRVLLEIKVERMVPEWAIRLIRRFGLVQRGFSKYCYVIDRHRESEAFPDRQAWLAW